MSTTASTTASASTSNATISSTAAPPPDSSAVNTTTTAAIAATATSIAPATSCSWQQVTENGKCFIEPRTCADCLNQPLANGDRCTLTPVGLCASMAAYDAAQDYSRPGAADAFPIRYNYFSGTNTSYCAANDKICQQCRDSTFVVDNDPNPSTYCAGENQCVCVRSCESPTWRNETLERLRKNASIALPTTTCPVAANVSLTIDESDNSTDSSHDAWPSLASAAIDKNIYANEDACRWYQNETFCNIPRSCYDCLNVPIYSGEKCTINPLGFCASMREYNASFDYRKRPAQNAPHFFPAISTTYCEPSDAACVQCRSASAASAQSNQYCVGASGCVCIAFCEAPQWQSLVANATCKVQVVNNVAPKEQFSVATIALMMIGFTLLFTGVVQLLTMWRTRRRAHFLRQRSVQRLERQRERRPFGEMHLQLDGWKSLCQDLISKEQQFMGDARQDSNTNAILTHGEGPSVIVEEGDGYRPLSPSYTSSTSTVVAAQHSNESRAAHV